MEIKEQGICICSNCNGILEFCGEYDAYFCVNCNEWAEKKCNDENCYFCVDRPDKPS